MRFLKTRWLSYGDIIRLKSVEEMVEIYYNSGQFSHTVEAVVREFPDAFTFYEALGAFYEEKGYDTLSHSRIRRYEIFWNSWKKEEQILWNFIRS